MQDKSPYSNNSEISNDLKEYINNFVKDAALSGKGFDTFSRYAKIYGNNENVDIEALLKNISALLDAIQKYNDNAENTTRQSIDEKSQKCFVSKDTIDLVLKHTNIDADKSKDTVKKIKIDSKPSNKTMLYAILGLCAIIIVILVLKNSNKNEAISNSDLTANAFSHEQNKNEIWKIENIETLNDSTSGWSAEPIVLKGTNYKTFVGHGVNGGYTIKDINAWAYWNKEVNKSMWKNFEMDSLASCIPTKIKNNNIGLCSLLIFVDHFRINDVSDIIDGLPMENKTLIRSYIKNKPEFLSNLSELTLDEIVELYSELLVFNLYIVKNSNQMNK